MNPVAIRLLNQQLVAPQFSDPAEVVGHLGAMQAQEYRLMRWAVAMRTKKPSAKAFKEAYDSGRILRLHLMRGTWQLITAEDYWPMLDLCASKAIKVIKGWMSSNKISIPDEELMRFTRKYFQSRQPATLEDFVWWSGLNVSDCRKGIALLGDTLHIERWKGRDFYLTNDCRTRGFRKGQFLLIPPYDEYLIGYKSRDIVLSPEHRHRAHNNSGIFQPIITYDGIVCGNWSPFKEDCRVEFFESNYGVENVQEAWKVYKRAMLNS